RRVAAARGRAAAREASAVPPPARAAAPRTLSPTRRSGNDRIAAPPCPRDRRDDRVPGQPPRGPRRRWRPAGFSPPPPPRPPGAVGLPGRQVPCRGPRGRRHPEPFRLPDGVGMTESRRPRARATGGMIVSLANRLAALAAVVVLLACTAGPARAARVRYHYVP